MSLYNLVNGYSQWCLFLLPMLGRKQEEWPRFRDCFLSDDEKRIVVFTRVGGGNRNCGFGEEDLYEDPNFVISYDSEYDDTYGYYEFIPPEKWKDDFQKIVRKDYANVSEEYVQYVKEFYPTLAENGVIDAAFERNAGGET